MTSYTLSFMLDTERDKAIEIIETNSMLTKHIKILDKDTPFKYGVAIVIEFNDPIWLYELGYKVGLSKHETNIKPNENIKDNL
jgi:hypothetical protein